LSIENSSESTTTPSQPALILPEELSIYNPQDGTLESPPMRGKRENLMGTPPSKYNA
jgi:hypothetical protein